MEQRIENQQYTSNSTYIGIHKNSNGINNTKSNRTRIKLFGRGYTIDSKRLELYQVIGDIIGAVGLFIECYVIYCVMWLYQ